MKERELKECIDSVGRQKTQLAILGMVVQVLYTVQGIRNVLHYDAIWKTLEMYRSYHGTHWNTMEDHSELDGRERKHVETTGYRTVWARLTPTFTHIVMCNPMTSGAKDEQCHHSPFRNDGLPQPKWSLAACALV